MYTEAPAKLIITEIIRIQREQPKMSQLVQFRLEDADYQRLIERSGSESPNLFARKILLKSLDSGPQISELQVKISVRILTIFQRYLAKNLSENELKELLNSAMEDENKLLNNMEIHS